MKKERMNFLDDENFKKTYKNANYELRKEENRFFYDLLINTYNDEEQIKFVKMANDYLRLAPVYSWLMYNIEVIKKNYDPKGEKDISEIQMPDNLKKAIGSFWGWVMLTDEKKEYIQNPVKQSLKRKNTLGFKTATLFDIKK